MQMWQKLGHSSKREWERATAKSRRAAKTAAKKAAAAATPPTVQCQWQPLQGLPSLPQQPGLAGTPPVLALPAPSAEGKTMGGRLPGRVCEVVQVTPEGRRKHIFTHVSPGGTAQADEYFSPAGVQERGQRTCRQRLTCMHRMHEKRRAAAPDRMARAVARDTQLRERVEAEPPRNQTALDAILNQQWKRIHCRSPRCDDCAACKRVDGWGQRGKGGEQGRMHAPCEAVLTRMGCRKSEFQIAYAILRDPTCLSPCCNQNSRICDV